MESFPAQIHASGWTAARDIRQQPYEGTWLEADTTKPADAIAEDLIINTIYADCFIATPVIPMPYQVKVNGTQIEISFTWNGQSYDMVYDDTTGEVTQK